MHSVQSTLKGKSDIMGGVFISRYATGQRLVEPNKKGYPSLPGEGVHLSSGTNSKILVLKSHTMLESRTHNWSQ